jgi:hypothetical protein
LSENRMPSRLGLGRTIIGGRAYSVAQALRL